MDGKEKGEEQTHHNILLFHAGSPALEPILYCWFPPGIGKEKIREKEKA